MRWDVRQPFLDEVSRFRRWQELCDSGLVSEKIGSLWEVDYPYWNEAYRAYCRVLEEMDAAVSDESLQDGMLYLIARNNETEDLIQETVSHEDWFEILCRRAVDCEEPEAKWQFAAYLPECSCNRAVKDLILKFAEDSHEYVSRRALLAMPALYPEQVERFAESFWYKSCGSAALQEYHRMAVLIALDEAQSGLLRRYLKLAKEDGRKYLSECAERISKKQEPPSHKETAKDKEDQPWNC